METGLVTVDSVTGEVIESSQIQAVQPFRLASDPIEALRLAEKIVRHMSEKCSGEQYVSTISGRKYPKVDWWTTVGMGVGLFAQEESIIDRSGEEMPQSDGKPGYKFEAKVGIYSGGVRVTGASHIASSSDSPKSWGKNEYSVRSMAVTRAVGKAFRIGFSGLAVMAGLEPTPMEEMPHDQQQGGQQGKQPPQTGTPVEMASEKQIEFIKNMAKSHLLTADEKSQIDAAVKKGMPKQKASDFIERLKAKVDTRKAEEDAKSDKDAQQNSSIAFDGETTAAAEAEYDRSVSQNTAGLFQEQLAGPDPNAPPRTENKAQRSRIMLGAMTAIKQADMPESEVKDMIAEMFGTPMASDDTLKAVLEKLSMDQLVEFKAAMSKPVEA